MTSSHEQKRTLFFFWSVRHALFRVLFLHQFGRHWAQNIGFVDTNRVDVFLFRILAGNGRIWRKSEKRGFWDGQKQANISIFVPRPQVFLTISQGSIIFFLLEDMSVMCLSLLTNTVGLKGKELQFMGKWSFFLIVRYYLFFFLVKVLIIRTFCEYASNAQLTLYIALQSIRRITTLFIYYLIIIVVSILQFAT